MGKKCKWLGWGILILLSVCACGDRIAMEEIELPPPPKVETLWEFEQALRDAGADLVEGESMASPIFKTQEGVFFLEGAPLLVYEFESAAGRDEALSAKMQEGFLLPILTDPPSASMRIWSPGRLVVLYAGDSGGSLLLLSGLLGDPVNVEPPRQDEPYPPAITVVIRQISEGRGIDPSRIQVLGYEAVQWEDACLGLPEPGEECPERLISGWEVRLRVGAEEIQVRVNSLGSEVREEK